MVPTLSWSAPGDNFGFLVGRFAPVLRAVRAHPAPCLQDPRARPWPRRWR